MKSTARARANASDTTPRKTRLFRLLSTSALGGSIGVAIAAPAMAQVCTTSSGLITCPPGTYTGASSASPSVPTTIDIQAGATITQNGAAVSNATASIAINGADGSSITRTAGGSTGAGAVSATIAAGATGSIAIDVDQVSNTSAGGRGILAVINSGPGGNISITSNGVNNTAPFLNTSTLSYGIWAVNNSTTANTVTVNSGLVNTTTQQGIGISASTTQGSLVLNSNELQTTGAGASGILAAGKTYTINSNEITTHGDALASGASAHGIQAQFSASPTGPAVINSNSVEIYGDGAYGIYAFGSTSTNQPVTINSGSVINHGDIFYRDPAQGGNGTWITPLGIIAIPYGSPTTVNSTSIETFGAIGHGIAAGGGSASVGALTINSGTITAHGAGAYGISTAGMYGNVTIVSDTITTSGGVIDQANVVGAFNGRTRFFGDAIEAISQTGFVDVTSNNATATGTDSNGITIVAATGANLVANNTSATSAAVTAIGIAVDAGAITAAINGTTSAPLGFGMQLAALNDADINLTIASTGSVVGRDGGVYADVGTGDLLITNRGRIEATSTTLGGSSRAALDLATSSGAPGSIVVHNYGAISSGLAALQGSAVSFGAANETLNLHTGSSIVGGIDGGAGTDTLALIGTSNTAGSSQVFGNVTSFEQLNVTSGAWTQNGAASVGAAGVASGATLIVADTLTGNATIAAGGTMQIGAGGTSGAVVGNIVDNGTLIFNRSNDYLFAGNFAGNGSLIKRGAGKVTLDGLYTFTGTTSIEAGQLKITNLASNGDLALGSGGAADLSGGGSQTIGGLTGSTGSSVNINQSTLTVNQGTGETSTFGGSLTGAGALVVDGGGTLNLTGNNTYTGPTTVNGGKLSINGQITSAVTVNAGGVVGGAGTINGSILLRPGAFLSPGNSPGVMTVGSLNLAGGSTTIVEVDPTGPITHDQINVTGAALIDPGANLDVQPLGAIAGYQRVNSYVIIDAAGGLTGTFTPSRVTSSMPLLLPRLSYAGGKVFLNLVRSDISFASLATTSNQARVAAAAEAMGAGAAPYEALLPQGTANLLVGFDALSGEIYGGASSAVVEYAGFEREMLLRHARDGQSGVWGEATGAYGQMKPGGGVADVTTNAAGLAIGVQGSGDKFTAGFGFAYTKGDVDAEDRFSEVEVQNYTLGAYAGFSAGVVDVSFGVQGGTQKYSGTRGIAIAGAPSVAASSYNGYSGQTFVEISHATNLAGFEVEPFVSYAVMHQQTDAFVEAGSALGLRVAAQTRDAQVTQLGARFSGEKIMDVYPEGSISWRRVSGDREGMSRASFAGSSSFVVDGAGLDKDALVIDASIKYQAQPNLTLGVGFNGVLGDETRTGAITGKLAMRF